MQARFYMTIDIYMTAISMAGRALKFIAQVRLSGIPDTAQGAQTVHVYGLVQFKSAANDPK